MPADILERLLITLAVRIHAFALCEIKTGWRLLIDSMEAVTIHYVLQGNGTISIDGAREVAFGPRCIIVVPAGVAQTLGHREAPEGIASAAENCSMEDDGLVKFTAGDGSRDIFVVCGNIAATYAGALGLFDYLREPIVQDLSSFEALRHVFEMMLDELAHPGVGTQAMTEALMKQCLILLLRQHLKGLSIDSPFFASLQDHRLARAVTAIVERPSAPHSVDSLAAIAGMSRSAFAERFSAVFGQSPIEFVQRVRLRLGAHLLASTDLPVKVIAASVGYKSRSYFTRAFTAAFGNDPTTYRALGGSEEEEPKPIERPEADVRIVREKPE